MDKATGHKVLELKNRIVPNFSVSDWEEVGMITGFSDLISKHDRLLRSLRFGDEDYAGSCISVLRTIEEKQPGIVEEIEKYLNMNYPLDNAVNVSSVPTEKTMTFSPNVFDVPDLTVESDLISVMMPFAKEFDPVYETIKSACIALGYRCLRADDIWENHTFMQDIFNLIVRSQAVIVDFSGRNANVMYETGIAHTLGKTVIPLTQVFSDMPSDMKHHRVLQYLLNREGLDKMEDGLLKRLQTIANRGNKDDVIDGGTF